MKLKLHLFYCLFFLNASIFSQSNHSGIIHYESTISSKKLDEYLTKKREDLKYKGGTVKMLDKVFLNTKSIKSKLTFSNGKGLFIVEDKLNINEHDLGQKVNRINAGGSKIFYYNLKNKTYLIKNCETLGECFIYTNKHLEWVLTQEIKKINGFLSYKATRNNGEIIAWYTPSIPVSFGPKGEYGLPGLILELEIGKIIFKANKIELNTKTEIKVEELKGGKRISYEEYTKKINKVKESIFRKGAKN